MENISLEYKRWQLSGFSVASLLKEENWKEIIKEFLDLHGVELVAKTPSVKKWFDDLHEFLTEGVEDTWFPTPYKGNFWIFNGNLYILKRNTDRANIKKAKYK